MSSAEPLACLKCDFVAPTRFSLNRHYLKTNHDQQEQPKDFTIKEELLEYDIDTIPDLTEEDATKLKQTNANISTIDLKCPKCDYLAKSNQALRCHLKVRRSKLKKSPPLMCSVCPFKSCTENLLTTHKWNEHKIKAEHSNTTTQWDF